MKKNSLLLLLFLFFCVSILQAQNTTSKTSTQKTVVSKVKKKKKSSTSSKKITKKTQKRKKIKVSDKPEVKVSSRVKAVEKAKVAAPVTTDDKPIVPKATITFSENSRDFGDITQGDKVSHIFKFKNTGTAPLIISNVQTTCGCTVPEWPKEPIAPGAAGEISATFNSANKSGIQQKVITIYSNAANDQATVKIIANVFQPKKTDNTAVKPQ